MKNILLVLMILGGTAAQGDELMLLSEPAETRTAAPEHDDWERSPAVRRASATAKAATVRVSTPATTVWVGEPVEIADTPFLRSYTAGTRMVGAYPSGVSVGGGMPMGSYGGYVMGGDGGMVCGPGGCSPATSYGGFASGGSEMVCGPGGCSPARPAGLFGGLFRGR